MRRGETKLSGNPVSITEAKIRTLPMMMLMGHGLDAIILLLPVFYLQNRRFGKIGS